MEQQLGTGKTPPNPNTSVLKVAVFDVDRTIVPITTTERIFVRYLIRNYLVQRPVTGICTLMRTLFFMARHIWPSPFAAIRQERVYLKGLPYAAMEQLAELCFESDIKRRVSKAALEAIQGHKREGYIVVLLSGSLDFLLRPLKRYVEAEHLIAADMEVVDGVFTGRILGGSFPYGSHKSQIITHFAQEHGIDLTRSYAYADHHTDFEVLKLFGNPIVVNPKRRMRLIAQREQWTIMLFG